MKRKVNLNNDAPSEYFQSSSEFMSVILKNIQFANPKDSSTLLCICIHKQFGEIFTIPISEAYASKQVNFDHIRMAKVYNEPFKGPFDKLDIKLEK